MNMDMKVDFYSKKKNRSNYVPILLFNERTL